VSYKDIVSRFEALVASGEAFTADDVTDDGALTVRGNHYPNASQNAIGTLFRQASIDRRIVPTGRVVKSRAPHRKGGMIREWRAS
jgi:hypothetical protein